MPWGFAAAAAATIGGAVLSSNASTSAADTQAQATRDANATQLQMFNQTQNNLAPYMSAGSTSLGQLMKQLGLWSDNGAPTGTPAPNSPLALPVYGSTINGMVAPQNFGAGQYQQSPGYKWELGQGLEAVRNSASAGGGVNGGNTLKALTGYAEGLANQDYERAYNDYLNNYNNAYSGLVNNSNTSFNRLQTLAGSGQNAAANLGSLSSQTAGQIGNNIIGAGNATAAGQVGSANSITGGLNNLSQLAFLYQQNPNLFGSGGGSSGVIGNSGGYTFGNGYNSGYGGG